MVCITDFVEWYKSMTFSPFLSKGVIMPELLFCSNQGFWYFAEKNAKFRGRKVKIRRKIDRFRGILAEKVKFRRIFRGKFIEKSADFAGVFFGKFR